MLDKQDGFKEFVLDQLNDLRGLTCRAMFGGYGLSRRGTFFGIVHQGRLYFKVSPATVASYRSHGMKPFRPNATMTLKTYYEVPPDILENSETLVAWAEQAASRPSAKQSRRTRAGGASRN
jgi:DNA transformation protein and related proteins